MTFRTPASGINYSSSFQSMAGDPVSIHFNSINRDKVSGQKEENKFCELEEFYIPF